MREHYENIIKEHELELERRDKDYENRNPIYRAERALELIDLGAPFKEVSQGFQVESATDYIIIAATKKKYRYGGNYKWYWYASLKKLLEAVGVL